MLGGDLDLGSAARMFRMEGHGVNGSTSVSKTESLGSNPSAPAKLEHDRCIMVSCRGIVSENHSFYAVEIAFGRDAIPGSRVGQMKCPKFHERIVTVFQRLTASIRSSSRASTVS